MLNDNKLSSSFKRAFPVAAVWFGILCGPSMASGVYATTYFSRWGGWMWVLVLIWMAFAAAGSLFGMRFCVAYKTYNYGAFFSALYTPKYWKFLKYPLDVYNGLSGIISEAAQLALGSTIFATLFGWHPLFGASVMAVIIIALMLWGDELVRRGCTYMTYFLLFGFIVLIYYTINIRGGAVADYVLNFNIYEDWNPGVGLWSGFWMIIQYAWNSMNIPGMVCSVAQPLKSKKDVTALSILGPLMVGLLFIGTSIITIGFAPESLSQESPILYAVSNFIAPVAKWVVVVYYLVMFFALFTSGPGLTLNITARWTPVFFKKSPNSKLSVGIVAVVFNIICIAVSTLGLTTLCAQGFTLLGKIAFPLIILPMLLTTWGRANRKFKENEEAEKAQAN